MELDPFISAQVCVPGDTINYLEREEWEKACRTIQQPCNFDQKRGQSYLKPHIQFAFYRNSQAQQSHGNMVFI